MWRWPTMRSPGSRAKSVRMPVSKTTPGRLGARVIAPIRVAFRQRNDVGTRDEGTALNGWLCAPCQRFADASRASAHDSRSMRFATPSSMTCTIYSCRSRRTPYPDTVAKVENRATRKISRKLIFGLLRRCVTFKATTEVLVDLRMKRCGLSVAARKTHQRLKISFVPQKTFATISPINRHHYRASACLKCATSRSCSAASVSSSKVRTASAPTGERSALP